MKSPAWLKKLGPHLVLFSIFVTSSAFLHAQVPTTASGQQTTPAANSPAVEQGEKDEAAELKHSKMVAAIGHMMGISTDAAATTFEVLNFAVLAIVVGGFLLKTMPKIFRNRSSAIQKELSEARSATEQASVRLNSVEERLAKLDDQIEQMKTQADIDATAEQKRFRAAAEEEKIKILAVAEQEIASATEQARRQLQQYAAGLAIDQAARRLVITEETDRVLIRNFAQRLGDQGTKGGEN